MFYSCLLIYHQMISYDFMIFFTSVSPWLYIWLWINTYRYSLLGDEHPFTSYFGVHQGYKVLTHPHMFRQVKHGKSREKLHRCPYRTVILSQSNRRVGTFSEKHACGSACIIGTYWSYNQHLDTGQQIGMGFVSFRPKYPGMQRFTS